MALIDIAGFIVPLEWVIAVAVSFGVLLIVFFLLVFKGKKPESPIVEDMALIQPIDEHDNLQPGQLVGGLQRTETDLIVTHPDWKDDEGNQYSAPVPIEKKVPFTFFDMSKSLKRLWVIADKGHLEASSASVVVKGAATRFDPPIADRRKAMRFLVNPPGKGASELLHGKKGLMFIMSLVTLSAVMFLFGYFVGV